jgi:sigma-E factor negative regulatory protein RseB
MPLKLNMLDLKGKLVKQIQVTQFQVTDTPNEFFSRINQDMLPAVSSISQTAHQHTWQVDYLPQGMQVIRRNTHRLSVTGQIVEYALLSDGLVDVSVYVMPSDQANLDNNIYRHEAKTMLTLVRGNVQISIIGEIPARTANEIATSLSPRVQ